MGQRKGLRKNMVDPDKFPAQHCSDGLLIPITRAKPQPAHTSTLKYFYTTT